MFLKKFLTSFTVACLALTLSACDGDDDKVVIAAPAPVPVVPVPAPVEADVTFRQISTRLDVLPGEEVRATVAVITGKGMNNDGVFPSFIPMGDFGIVDSTGSEYEAQNLELYYLGQKVEGLVRYEGAGTYRFRANSTFFVYRAGSLEVRAVVSPWAPTGTVHTLAIKTTSAAYDKTVEVVGAKAELVVRADPAYQPMELGTNSSGFVNPNADGTPTTANFTARCGAQVNGCFASLDFGRLIRLVPGSSVVICRYAGGLGDSAECFTYAEVDQFGEVYLNFGLETTPGALTTYQVRFSPAQPTYLFAERVQSWVSGKELAPRILNFKECMALSQLYCKG